jgi:hypothetical protein
MSTRAPGTVLAARRKNGVLSQPDFDALPFLIHRK